MNSPPKTAPAAVVIVNYNRAELTLTCVASVLAQREPPAQVIVVDNGSDDGSAARVEERFGTAVQLIRLDRNLGFAGGNNQGIKAASTPWIALLNNDAAADPNWLGRMLRAAGDDARTGLVACRVLRADRRELLDNIGVRIGADGMSRGASHFRRDGERPDQAVFIPSGCAMMMRREAFVEAGGFDESLFCYSEDTDLFVKIRLLGYRCVLAPDAVVYHEGGGGTLGVISPEKIYLVERNRIAVLVRYYPILLIILSPVFTLRRYLALAGGILGLVWKSPSWISRENDGRESGSSRARGWIGCIASLLRAYWDGLARLPRDWRVRKQWQSCSRLPVGTISMWISIYSLDSKSLKELMPP